MIAKNETIVGVVGAGGDLGRQVASMAVESGFTVLRSDKRKILGSTSINTLLEVSDIVHFAIPEDGFEDEYAPRDGQVMIVNDSVMATSRRISASHFDGQADTVHMLMNEPAKNKPQDKLLRLVNSAKHGFRVYPAARGTVVVEQDNPHLELVKGHMSALGLQAVEMSQDKHDYIMARSQAPLAVLVKLLLDELQEWRQAKVLTPSGDALLNALEARAAKWTDTTMEALLKNPELDGFIADIQQLRTDGGKIHGSK